MEANLERARGLAWRLVGGDADLARDVVQDAFVRAWRGLARFRGDATLDTWFYRILVRQAHNARRWRGLRERLGGLPGSDPEQIERQPDPEGPKGDPWLRQRVFTALDGLPAAQRETFVLVHLEGFTVREAAELTGRREGTAKTHLKRALQKLRAELGDLAPASREESDDD